MTDLQKRLFELQDEKYQAFQSKLIPTIDPKTVIGIRVPVLRDFAKTYKTEIDSKKFLENPKHDFYEENLLHMILLTYEKDFDQWILQIEKFLPYIDNWAVCDMNHPKIVKKNHQRLLPHILKWIKSEHSYTVRFGLGLLMSDFLDDDFHTDYLKIASNVKSDEYYVNMMIAWYFATALAKQWDAAIKYFEQPVMEKWTHNKSIQKALESFRVSDEHKDYLRTLKL